MDNFDLKRFLVENKLTRNSILLNENQIPQDIEEFLNNMINFEVLDDLSDNVEEGDNVNGVWEIEEYGDEEIYGEAADDFKKAYQYIKNNGGKITIPGNPDVTYNAIYDGSIGYSLNVTLNELDYDLSNNSYFGTPTTTFDTFDKFGRKPRKNTKWTKDTLEQEADKYTTSGEFQKANVNVYNIYRAAVRKGLIQDKFERFGFGNKWTKDALEQEANKYNSATEFNQNSGSAYQSYINAVNKGLIQNKFKRSIKWTKDALEQEAAKYNTSGEFQQNNNSAYVTYINAVNKGLIQSKFKGVEKNGGIIKWTKDALEQEAAKYNTSGEFQKANINAYTIYRTAVRKGLIPNKFEEQNKWTKDALEQEASKYNSPAEFQKSNVSAYQRYREAVNKGLIPDRFEDNRINVRWTPEKLEQEAAKYTTQNDFFKTNQAAFVAYKRAAKKGLIQDKFKKDKPTLKENKMQDFDLKRFLIENKMTRNSRLLNEQPETEGIPADDPLAQIPAVPAETPSEPSGEIDKETAKELIFGTKGKFFTVTFIKKDGSERVMNARLGVKKYLRGGELRYDPAEFNYITVYDMGAKGYRMVNANTIQNLKIGKNEYVIPTAVSE